MKNSIEFYNNNAKHFFEGTSEVDMTELYAEFTPFIKQGSEILDAGCGSGRDTKYFMSKGYRVIAFDASEELVALASSHCKIDISCMTFNEVDWVEKFSGIWACASLLHLDDVELRNTFSKLIKSLKSTGVIYCSFKYGNTATNHDERYFNNKTEATLKELLGNELPIKFKKCWITNDKRPQRSDEKWLNVIIKKE